MTGSIGWCIFLRKTQQAGLQCYVKRNRHGPDVCRHKRGTGTKINPGVPRE